MYMQKVKSFFSQQSQIIHRILSIFMKQKSNYLFLIKHKNKSGLKDFSSVFLIHFYWNKQKKSNNINIKIYVI